MKRPAFQMYVGDWKKDPSLAMCSLAARAFWLEVCMAMKELVASQITGTVQQLAQIARTDSATAKLAIEELQKTETADVHTCDAKVTLVCRRYVRELRELQLHATRQDRYRSRKLDARPIGQSDATVTASDSRTAASSSTAVAAAESVVSLDDFPETATAVQESFPGTSDHVVVAIVNAARSVRPDASDGEVTKALLLTHKGRQQSSAALWMHTVPAFLAVRPKSRAAPPDDAATCPNCGEIGLCACLKAQIAEVKKPPGQVFLFKSATAGVGNP